MESTFVKINDAVLEKTEKEVAVLVHKTELLRLKNRLRSPLLRLPTETIVHILSYIMEDMEHPHIWRPIFSTCCRIYIIVCTTSKLWRKANFKLDKAASLAFARSMGNLEEITIDFAGAGLKGGIHQKTKKAVDFCRENVLLPGRSLHTVDLSGTPSDMTHWSWIFEQPLPCLRRLKIHFLAEWEDGPLSNPVVLELPTDLRLRVLDLYIAPCCLGHPTFSPS